MVDAERAQLEAAQEAARLVSEHQAGEVGRLTTALEQARQRHADEVAQQRDELIEQSKNAGEAQEQLRAKIASANALTDAARQQQDLVQESARENIEVAQAEAREAREGAAQLRGQVDALQAHTAGLMRLLAERLGTALDVDPTLPS